MEDRRKLSYKKEPYNFSLCFKCELYFRLNMSEGLYNNEENCYSSSYQLFYCINDVRTLL
ncbi:uncharacterized protein HKW66_Vig0080110 [Vigna angularis]|uniref:Uncharacterized protein n=1 Tax=Phaseolus angularis TaxID=3914 RepID=A0A8T0KHX6_PHAAN|nr:uncharacterized protein HKW66_Vig0080110 [Vigna angularis]